MKIRTDFVTNSSSSGFVCINVKTDESQFQIYDDYDSGWGGWIWNYRDTETLKDSIGDVKTGEELYALLMEYVENLQYFPKSNEFHGFLSNIKDKSELKTVELQESTSSDDGDDYVFSLSYDYKKGIITDYKDGYVKNSRGSSVSYESIKHMSERELFDLYEYHFDGCDEAVLEMSTFFSCLTKEEQDEVIGDFEKNGIHFNKSDKYVGWIKGSSNRLLDLIDIDALIESINEDEEDDW